MSKAIKILNDNTPAIKKRFEQNGMSDVFEREMGFAKMAIAKNSQIANCNPNTIIESVAKIALLGLTLNPTLGFAYLIPRKKSCVLEIGFKGWVDLVQKNNAVKKIEADVICSNDEFDFELGTSPFIKHKPNYLGDRGELQAAYCILTLNSGEKVFKVMNKAEIMKRKAVSQGTDSNYSPWRKWEDEMWLKTVIKFTIDKFAPKSEQLAQVLAHENESTNLYTADTLDISYEDADPLSDLIEPTEEEEVK